jgi:8-oxo-dGTP pyrophosphatase MutT (NUDIX family)
MYNIKFPVAFHPVDMAITRRTNPGVMSQGRIQVLLAQKNKDSEGGNNVWRFPGGFIDPWDSCAEEAALRESMEETGMKFFNGFRCDNGVILNEDYFDNFFEMRQVLIDQLVVLQKNVDIIHADLYDAEVAKISQIIKQLGTIKLDRGATTWLRKNLTYIGSTQIDDARFRETDHSVITSFYELTPRPGFDKDGEGPFDDIARTKWFYLSEITDEEVHPAHKELVSMLKEKYKDQMNMESLFSDIEEAVSDVEEAIRTAEVKFTTLFNEFEENLPEMEKKAKEKIEKMHNKLANIIKTILD